MTLGFLSTQAAPIPIDVMAYRSDRPGVKPVFSLARRGRCKRLAPRERNFHRGQGPLFSAPPNRPKIRLQSVPHITTVVSAAVERKPALINLSGDPGGLLPIALRSNHGARRRQGFPRSARRPKPPSVVLETMGDGQRVGSGHRVCLLWNMQERRELKNLSEMP
jgi:hypothetical protein